LRRRKMEEAIERFISYLRAERGFSPNTAQAYKNDLIQFREEIKKESLKDVRKEDIVNYIAYLKDRGYAPATIARKIASIRSFFGFLRKNGEIDEDPSREIQGPKIKRLLPRTIGVEDVERLLREASRDKSPEGKRDRAMIEVLYATGMRVSELVSLNVDNVDLKDGFITCYGKGFRERVIPIHARALSSLKEYIEEARPYLVKDRDEKALFVNRRGERLTRQGFWLILKNHARRAGIKDITPHILRHSIATHLLQSGKMNLRELQEFLGHANISTTQIYTHITDEHMRRIYERTHPRGK